MRTLQTIAALLALALLAGCRITNSKNGKNDDVDLKSPFGSMHIKTDDNVDTAALGLTTYPGSTAWKDDDADAKNHNNHTSDSNMSLGDCFLRVKDSTFRC